MERLLYISQGKTPGDHVDNTYRMLEAGCRWIQLRIKDLSEEDLLPYAQKAADLCRAYDARLTINDFPKVALAARAWGVHLGLKDMSIPCCREIVENRLKIGGTANTLSDVHQRIDDGVDYIGLGPLRFTSTKKKLSPILGFDGINKIIRDEKVVEAGVPIIIVGGVTLKDTFQLIRMGIFGVGVSSELTHSNSAKQLIRNFKEELNGSVTYSR